MVLKYFRIIFSVILILINLNIQSENSIAIKLRLLDVLIHQNEDNWNFMGIGSGGIKYSSKTTMNVKAEIAMDAVMSGMEIEPEISRASIMVRFPVVSVTIGKTRLSWGEGFCFNSGDILSNSTGFSVDLTEKQIRDEAVWLTALYFPIGDLSFIELTTLMPELELKNAAFGGRGVIETGKIKFETGYLYNGKEKLHKTYISLFWTMFFDWHLSSSINIPEENPEIKDVGESLNISWGLFYIQKIRSNILLTYRLEGLIIPMADWKASDFNTEYGMLLYPELKMNLNSRTDIFIRSIFSPIDLSALNLIGCDWNVYQGLHVLSYFSIQAGEKEDIFGWGKEGDVSFSMGFQYTY